MTFYYKKKIYLTLVKMAIIKRNTNNKRWWGCEEKGTLVHYWWLSKLVQSLWKTVWRFRKKLKVEIPCVLSCSVTSNSATPWTVARQAPLSMRLSWQEYWSGLPFPPPGDLSDPWTEPMSPALAGGFFTTEPPGSPEISYAQQFHSWVCIWKKQKH